MFRRLRRLLAFGLVASVCVLGVGQEAAQASSTAWVQANVSVDIGGGTQDFICQASFRIATMGTLTVIDEAPGGRCIGGRDLSPGWCGIGEVGCTDFAWAIKGPGCGSSSAGLAMLPVVGSSSADSTFHVAFSLGAYQATSGACDPTEICATIGGTGVGPDNSGSGCAPLGLDPPEVVVSPCTYGAMSGATVEKINELGNNGGAWYLATAFRWGQVVVTGPTGSDWLMYVVKADNGNSVGMGSDAAGATGPTIAKNIQTTGIISTYSGRIMPPEGKDGSGSMNFGTRNNWQSGPGVEPTTPVLASVVGVGMIRKADFPTWSSASVWATPAHGAANGTAANTGPNFIGMNQPTRCAFYFGAKFWDMAGTTVDDPAGALDVVEELPPDPDPLPDPEECDGFFCLGSLLDGVLGALGDILDALTGLGADIASAITGALTDLFVPSGEVLGDAMEDVSDSFELEAITDWLQLAENLTPDGPSGCSGPTVGPLHLGTAADLPAFQPINACSGAAATAAHWAKIFCYVSISIIGFKSCVNSILGGLGARVLWNVGGTDRE